MTGNIDPQEFGAMRADVGNIKDTQEIMRVDFKTATARIEASVEKGFEKQSEINETLFAKIATNAKKIHWIIYVLAGSGLLSGGAWKVFG